MTTLIVFRLIHIVTGVFWAGAVMLVAWFIIPATKRMGPEGGKFMQALANTNKYPLVVNLAALLNILSGLYLYDKLSAHFTNAAWIHSGYGMSMTIGGICAIFALVYGTIMVRPAADKIGKIGKEVAASGGPPSEEQQQQMAGYAARIASGVRLLAIFLFIAVAFMAVGRYMN
jgi:hypothetical protein